MWISLMSLYFIIWGCTLYLLFKRIKAVDRLLPNKKVFFTHGIFVGIYLMFVILMQLSNLLLKYYKSCELNCLYLLYGTHNILNTLSILCDYATYVIVLYLLVPRAKEQSEISESYQEINFMMMNGLKNVGGI
jgi:hypothetical protein